jgi:hypothetical protein
MCRDVCKVTSQLIPSHLVQSACHTCMSSFLKVAATKAELPPADVPLTCHDGINPLQALLLPRRHAGYVTCPCLCLLAMHTNHATSGPVCRSLKRRAAAVMRMGTGTPGSAPDSTQQSQSSSDAGKGDGGMQALRDASSASGHSPWDALYVARCVRTARGACGYLHRAWPGPWRLYALPQGECYCALGPTTLPLWQQLSHQSRGVIAVVHRHWQRGACVVSLSHVWSTAACSPGLPRSMLRSACLQQHLQASSSNMCKVILVHVLLCRGCERHWPLCADKCHTAQHQGDCSSSS